MSHDEKYNGSCPYAVPPVIFCWSGGKDSALALHEVTVSREYPVKILLTTVTADYDRISMHGVRTVLLEQQAEALGLRLEKVFISAASSNAEYGEKCPVF